MSAIAGIYRFNGEPVQIENGSLSFGFPFFKKI